MFLYCLSYFTALILFVIFLSIAHKKFYLKPLTLIQDRLYQLPNDIVNECDRQKLTDFCIYDLAEITNQIVDNYKLLYIDANNDTSNPSSIELHNSILYLILTERYLNPTKKLMNCLTSIKISSDDN